MQGSIIESTTYGGLKENRHLPLLSNKAPPPLQRKLVGLEVFVTGSG